MKELKLGKMTSREIAQWMGITYETYRKKTKQRLEQIQNFCEFEQVYGGIIVKEIYIPVYDKGLNKKDDEKYLKEIKSCQDGLSTLSGMARKFKQFDEDFKDLSERQIRRRMAASASRLFGKTRGETGIVGIREYIWAIKLDDYNHYRLLAPEEDERFNEIISCLYGDKPKLVRKAALLEEEYKTNDDMSKEEYFNLKERLGLNLFKDCIFQFRNETGYMIVHCTKHDLLNNFIISDEDRAYLESLEQ